MTTVAAYTPAPQQAAATSPTAAAAADNKPVLAEKYKTKMCRNFVTTGVCPYESRCMFAHGTDELRTKEMNLHDGLTTEEAIRNFKRMQSFKNQYKNLPSAAAMNVAVAPRVPVSPQTSPYGRYSCDCAQCATVGSAGYRYNPYSWENVYAPVCQCPDCVALTYVTAPNCDCPECQGTAMWDAPAAPVVAPSSLKVAPESISMP